MKTLQELKTMNKVSQKKLTEQETTAIAKSMRKGELDVHLWNKIDLKIWASAVVKCLMSEILIKTRGASR
ncbi:MAG: hypothetical protein FJY17_00625 [Bacteroidetes bacterium]|nr:hypothetical protein [Bacteroidota bacterium]